MEDITFVDTKEWSSRYAPVKPGTGCGCFNHVAFTTVSGVTPKPPKCS
jgi:hypothetical protein